jgi:TetR/AcrR family transcriptional regulator, transcriptional repressor for nem operon
MPRSSASSVRPSPDTAAQILDVAERLAQTRGFNGFSYADIAGELGVTKASLHYHYASKADLGRALIDRYSASFAAAFEAIDRSSISAADKLQRYVKIYADVLRAGRICLCGMLAAEYTTLPAPMQQAIKDFFDANERGLARMLESGRKDGSLSFDGPSADAARAITAALEGAMLLARPYGGADRFVNAAKRVLAEFEPSKAPRRAAPNRKRRTNKP